MATGRGGAPGNEGALTRPVALALPRPAGRLADFRLYGAFTGVPTGVANSQHRIITLPRLSAGAVCHKPIQGNQLR